MRYTVTLTSIRKDKKYYELGATLKITRDVAVARVLDFRAWAADCFGDPAERGDLREMPDEVIALNSGWTKSASVFVTALVKHGFLGSDRIIPDWMEQHGAYLRDRDRNRMRRGQASSYLSADTSMDRSADGSMDTSMEVTSENAICYGDVSAARTKRTNEYEKRHLENVNETMQPDGGSPGSVVSFFRSLRREKDQKPALTERDVIRHGKALVAAIGEERGLRAAQRAGPEICRADKPGAWLNAWIARRGFGSGWTVGDPAEAAERAEDDRKRADLAARPRTGEPTAIGELLATVMPPETARGDA